jgi:hypothetical protein
MLGEAPSGADETTPALRPGQPRSSDRRVFAGAASVRWPAAAALNAADHAHSSSSRRFTALRSCQVSHLGDPSVRAGLRSR